jgi:hypothetical protein
VRKSYLLISPMLPACGWATSVAITVCLYIALVPPADGCRRRRSRLGCSFLRIAAAGFGGLQELKDLLNSGAHGFLFLVR